VVAPARATSKLRLRYLQSASAPRRSRTPSSQVQLTQTPWTKTRQMGLPTWSRLLGCWRLWACRRV